MCNWPPPPLPPPPPLLPPLQREAALPRPLITVDVQSSVPFSKVFMRKPLCCLLLINTWLHLSYFDAAVLIQKAIRGAKPTKPLDASAATTINEFIVSHSATEPHGTQTPKERVSKCNLVEYKFFIGHQRKLSDLQHDLLSC